MNYPDFPLSPEAEHLFKLIKPQIEMELELVKKTPVSILVWGPDPTLDNEISALRVEIRNTLRKNGHAAFFSEELCDPSQNFSLRIQQLAQARKFDLIFSIPCSHGSIGEAHDFAADRRVNAKMLLFLNQQLAQGYSAQSLQAISSFMSCQIIYYNGNNDLDIIKNTVFEEVDKIRDIKYLLAGRY